MRFAKPALLLFVLVCLLQGCNLIQSPDVDENGQTSPTADMGSGEPDLSRDEEMSSSMDMPDSSMALDLGSEDASSDADLGEGCDPETCDGVCEESVCVPAVACEPGCGEMEGCVDGTCVDLLANDDHCGDVGLQCAPDSQCNEGVCACDKPPLDNFRSYPHLLTSNKRVNTLLMPISNDARFVCPNGSGPRNCPPTTLELAQDYAFDRPHYVIARPDETNENVVLTVIDEQGEILETQKLGAPTSAQASDFRLAHMSDTVRFPGNLLFTAWCRESNQDDCSITATLLRVDDSTDELSTKTLELQGGRGGATAWVTSERHIEDFAVRELRHMRDGMDVIETYGIAYITGAPEDAANGLLHIDLFTFDFSEDFDNQPYSILSTDPESIGTLYQRGTGFSLRLSRSGEALFASVVLAEERQDGDEAVVGPAPDLPQGSAQLIYRQRVFQTQIPRPGFNPPTFERPLSNQALGATLLGAEVVQSLKMRDAVIGPAPGLHLATGNAWIGILWNRGLVRSQARIFYRTPQNYIHQDQQESYENAVITDQSLALFPGDLLRLAWISQGTGNMKTPQPPRIGRFVDENGTVVLRDVQAIGSAVFGSRVDAEPGTRTMGVLVTTNNELRFYVAVDGQPACQF